MTNNTAQLTQDDVMEVMRFANMIYNTGYGVFTPQLMNQNLNNLNNNPLIPNKTSLESALKNYKYSAESLQAYNEFAQVYDSLFQRTINYYAGLLAFDLHITCSNMYRTADYASQEYIEDKRRVAKFFDNFNYVEEFSRIVKNMIRNEVFYTWFRDSVGTFDNTGTIELEGEENANKTKKMPKYTLQVIPQQRCLLTGKWEMGFLFDFDMYYFLQAGVDINAYDPAFKKYFRNVFGDGDDINYNPTAQLNERNGTFSLWTQTSPDDGAWCWKLASDNGNTTPFLSSLIKQVLTNEEMLKLQNDKAILEARGILAGEIEMMDKQVGGQTPDSMAFNPATLTKFLSLVKMGLGNNINAVAMPTKDVDFYQYENKNPNSYSQQLKNSAGNAASAAGLIYSEGKTSQFEMQSQIVTDYNFINKVYPQFENFLNFYINKKTRKYKFKFHFGGCTYPFIREKEKSNLLDLANVGMVVNPSAYSKILDMTPFEFERSLEESKYTKWTDKLLSQLLSIHTQSGKDGDGKGGAPKKSDTELEEGGSIARDYEGPM